MATMMDIPLRDVARFWRNVYKTDGCWLWIKPPHRLGPWGYGRFVFRYKQYAAHRFAYLLTYGDIPDGAVVRHTCDTPMCVRPDHLLVGTHQDNVNDQIARGRRKKKTVYERIMTAAKHETGLRLTVDDVRQLAQDHYRGAIREKRKKQSC